MDTQTVFERYELKYLLSKKQKDTILKAIDPYMHLDRYGHTTIRNLYFDTDSYRIIRRSIDKPVYKEKLRIRSYEKACPDSTVFVELKKKYESIVYKRRIPLPEEDAMAWLSCGQPSSCNNQICAEIEYFISYYGPLHPAVFLSYDREAYDCLHEEDFRVTFDDNILCRQDALSLQANIRGLTLLPEDMVLMELKCSGGMPLWMAHVLNREKIYRTSFSKYGTAYQKLIYPKHKEEALYA